MVSADNGDIWDRLARAAGRRPDRFTLGREWRKRTPTQDQVVRLYVSPEESLIFKQIHRPVDRKQAHDRIDAQMRAAEAMSTGQARVPDVLEFDPEARACLMQVAPGNTVYDMIAGDAPPADCLRRAGRWMAAFHRSGGTEERVYQPKFMRNHMKHLLEQDAAGEIALADAQAFGRQARKAIALAQQYEGRRTLSAVTHGDMHLRNILLDGPRSYGIDFSARRHAPVGFDIARFLLHYVGVFGDLDQVPKGHVVPPAILSAFFDGYDLVGAADPSVGFLLRVRILMDWAAIPGRVLDRSHGQGRRLRRLKKLARIALA